MRESLFAQWAELKTPAAERVEALAALLDAALPSPQLLARFDFLQSKLADRVPIAQVASTPPSTFTHSFIPSFVCPASRPSADGSSWSTS